MSTTSPGARTTDASTRTPRNALLIAAAVGIAIAALGIIGSLLDVFSDFVTGIYADFSGVDAYGWFAPQLVGMAAYLGVWALPVAAGVFLSLRYVAPITASANTAAVLARALVATAIGAAAGVVLSYPVSMAPSIAFGDVSGGGFLGTLFEMARRSVELIPLVLLAVTLGWLWLRRTPAD